MKKLMVLSLVVMMLFAFVACKSEPGGKSGGGSGELTPAEQAIRSEYGDDVFYFAELVDIASSYAEMIQDICGASDNNTRNSTVAMYNQYSQDFSISNASATGLTVEGTFDGDHIRVVISNVKFSNPKGQWVSFDAEVTVSGSFNATAQVSLEVYLSNGSLTITDGRYNSISFGQGTPNNLKANQCLQEIQALDENGNNSGQGGQGGQEGQGGGYNPGQDPGQGDEWTMGTASLPAHTAQEIALALEGMDYYVLIEEPQGGVGVKEGGASYFYEYGLIHGGSSEADQVWAKRWDELPALYGQESQYDMIALDRRPGVQFEDPYEHVVSDYIYYESDAYSDAWYGPSTGVYHDEDGSRNWHDAVVYWVYEGEDIFSDEYAQSGGYNATYAGGIFYHYSDLVKPYTPMLLSEYNGKYEKLSRTEVVAGLQCSIYRYAGELYYIADSEDFYNICLKHTWLVQGKEYVIFEVQEIHTFPKWPVD